jgi:hypothetical protein
MVTYQGSSFLAITTNSNQVPCSVNPCVQASVNTTYWQTVALAGSNGSNGTNGTNGAAATVTVGPTTTGAAGTSASVSNSGTSSAAVFNFTIPQGATGPAGTNGTNGTNGSTGATGATGVAGATGPAGPNLITSSTVTTITGLLKGNGSTVSGATAGSDYLAPTGSGAGLTGVSLKIANGSSALNTVAIASYACNTTTIVASGVVATDRVEWSTSGSIIAVTGYVPSASGGLSLYPAYTGSGSVNFPVCNWTPLSITPGVVTVLWGVTR